MSKYFMHLEPLSARKEFIRVEGVRFFEQGAEPFIDDYVAGMVACYRSEQLVEFKITTSDGKVPFVAFRTAVQERFRDTPVEQVIWDTRQRGKEIRPMTLRIRK